jgi:hypothetical protein
MPKDTMSHEDEWKLPKDVPLPAELTAVSVREIPYVKDGEKKTFTKWEWEFKITEGEYAGLRAWGDTDPRLTNHPDNKVRQWAETLRGREFEMGEGLDTDDLLGLPCTIVVDNTIHTKKATGEKSYICPVVDVLPSGIDSEPPF